MTTAKPLAEHNEDECAECGEPYALREGMDPTEFCDVCAHLKVELLTARVAELEAEQEVLAWNLGGCSTYALGYDLDKEPDPTMARAALHDVRKLRIAYNELEARLAVPIDSEVQAMIEFLVADGPHELTRMLERLARENQHLRSAAGQVEKDAARYRFLRAQYWDESSLFVISGSKSQVRLGTDCPSHERLDETIDAAIKASE